MNTENKNKTILLIGGTGNLGGMIANELLDRDVNLRLYVRPGSRSKLSGEILDKVEITEDESQAFQNVYAVVSAVQGGPDTIVNDQLRWLNAAKKAGVKRFIPSDFSFDFFKLEEGDNINSDWRRAFALQADEQRGIVEVVHVLIGGFLDKGVLYGFLGAFDLEKGEAFLWGDGNEKMDLTTYAGAASYIAEVAIDDDSLPDKLFFAGESLDFHEMVNKTEAGLGKKLTVRKMGTLADLDTEISQRMQAQPKNFFAWLPMMYWRGMLNGKGKLGALSNDRYPDVKPKDIVTYLKS